MNSIRNICFYFIPLIFFFGTCFFVEVVTYHLLPYEEGGMSLWSTFKDVWYRSQSFYALVISILIFISMILKQYRLKTQTKKKTFPPFIIIFLLLAVFWPSNLISLWTYGLVYATEDAHWTGHKIDGKYSVTIDLSDLNSNIGKELYNDGTHKIYISHVDNTSDVKYGGYRVQFRSGGQYSLEGASLVSGIQHIKLGEYEYTFNMTAEMKAEYNGQTYESSVSSFTGLNYEDGDAFSFYIFPSSAFESQKVTLKENGKVHLTVTNLYKNIWDKK